MHTLPPLVEPSAELSGAELARYARHLTLAECGLEGQRRLASARVLVIGAGGLGSPALLYLAAAGVGTLGIIDPDVVDETNLHRQVIHGQSWVGRPKVESAAAAIAEVNPYVVVEQHPTRLTNANAVDLLSHYDLILDGTDNFATRYLVADAAEIADRPYVWGSILRFHGQVSVFWASHGPTYRDLFPEPPAPGTVPSCAEGGVLGVLCAAVGSVMATEAVKLITGMGQSLLGRLLIHDALAMSYDIIELAADPQRTPVTELSDYQLLCGIPSESPAGNENLDAVGSVDVVALQDWLAERTDGNREFALVDVREPYEREINSIDGSVSVPMATLVADPDALLAAGIPLTQPVVLYCKAGVRSQRCGEALVAHGRREVVSVTGGIDAWVEQIQPELRRY